MLSTFIQRVRKWTKVKKKVKTFFIFHVKSQISRKPLEIQSWKYSHCVRSEAVHGDTVVTTFVPIGRPELFCTFWGGCWYHPTTFFGHSGPLTDMARYGKIWQNFGTSSRNVAQLLQLITLLVLMIESCGWYRWNRLEQLYKLGKFEIASCSSCVINVVCKRRQEK